MQFNIKSRYSLRCCKRRSSQSGRAMQCTPPFLPAAIQSYDDQAMNERGKELRFLLLKSLASCRRGCFVPTTLHELVFKILIIFVPQLLILTGVTIITCTLSTIKKSWLFLWHAAAPSSYLLSFLLAFCFDTVLLGYRVFPVEFGSVHALTLQSIWMWRPTSTLTPLRLVTLQLSRPLWYNWFNK